MVEEEVHRKMSLRNKNHRHICFRRQRKRVDRAEQCIYLPRCAGDFGVES